MCLRELHDGGAAPAQCWPLRAPDDRNGRHGGEDARSEHADQVGLRVDTGSRTRKIDCKVSFASTFDHDAGSSINLAANNFTERSFEMISGRLLQKLNISCFHKLLKAFQLKLLAKQITGCYCGGATWHLSQ